MEASPVPMSVSACNHHQDRVGSSFAYACSEARRNPNHLRQDDSGGGGCVLVVAAAEQRLKIEQK